MSDPASSLPAPSVADPVTMNCPYCAEPISAQAKKCRHCGEILDATLRTLEELKHRTAQQPMVFMNAGGGSSAASSSAASGTGAVVGHKSRGVAAVLAFLLGGIGIHKFYLGQPIWGIIYLLFSWTFVPIVLGWIEGIGYLLTSKHRFALKFG